MSSWNVLILFRDNPDIQHFLSSASWECGNYKSMECIKHRGLRGVCCTSLNSLTLRSHIALIPGSVWKVVSNYDYLRELPGSQVKRTHWWWKNKMALWEKIITCFLLHILPNNILFEKKILNTSGHRGSYWRQKSQLQTTRRKLQTWQTCFQCEQPDTDVIQENNDDSIIGILW